MITRDTAIELIQSQIKAKNLIKHMFAVECSMSALAEYFNEDVSKWAIAGLLHDLDYELTKDDFSQHGLITRELLEDHEISNEVLDAITAHAGHGNHMPKSRIEIALYAVDPATGFIVACALMHPSKKLSEIVLTFMKKRFKEKRFAAGARREQMAYSEKLGLNIDDFLSICLKAMKNISGELGL